MKVKELIEKLSQLDPELPVVKRAKEAFTDAEDPELDYFVFNINTDWFKGPHEKSVKFSKSKQAVLI
jgi:hypothetical protein